MHLFAFGINHRSADLALREQFAFTPQQTSEIVRSLQANQAVEEAVVLSTCNRTEIYTATKCHFSVKEWLRHQCKMDCALLGSQTYQYLNVAMVQHLMTVASGLDSMVLGEPQILGQLKRAYQCAVEVGTVGSSFKQLFPAVFEAAKAVRATTDIGRGPLTVAYAAIQLARQSIKRLENSTVILIGAGETVELLASYLQKLPVKRLIFANRTLERAHRLARNFGGVPVRLNDLKTSLLEADLVLSATTSRSPILSYDQVESVMRQRANKPMLMIDLAVPRDIEESVAMQKGVSLYNIDDLKQVVDQSQRGRMQAVQAARTIIEVKAAHYLRQLRVRQAGAMIQTFRQKMNEWQNDAVKKALCHLEGSHDPQDVVAELARNLTNKFIYQPTKKMRQAAYDEHDALMQLIKELYEL